MTEYYVEEAVGRRRVSLAPPIAKGAAGTIHKIVREPGLVAKLYIDPKDCREYRDKVTAMIATPPRLPPIVEHGREYVQIAWPIASITDARNDFRGFVMPEVDLTRATELENILQKSMRRQKKLPEFYGSRVLLAANMSSLLAELHALGHYMIDMKPSNMRFYPHISYMAILDTDGFNINGVSRFPARQFSDDYIAPEAKGKLPDQLGVEQDLFALAVIIFQLLNNGIHPFQGVDRRLLGNTPNTRQERIFARLYAYGRAPNPSIGPTSASIHEYLEPETRELFDRAFSNPSNRPTAEEWRRHLVDLITSKRLVMCSVNPRDHGHFSKGCGLCALERRMAAAQMSSAVFSGTQVPRSSPIVRTRAPKPAGGHIPRPAVVYGSTPPTVPPVQISISGGAKGLVLALLALFAIAVFAALFSGGPKEVAPPPPELPKVAPSPPPEIPPVSATTPQPSTPPSKPRQATDPSVVSESPIAKQAPSRQEPPARTAAPRCVTFNNRMICE